MNIVVLHGDDTAKSYQRLIKFIEIAKKRNWEIARLDASKNINLKQELLTNSLFVKNKLVILEEPNKLLKRDLRWLNSNQESISATLVLYSNVVLGSVFLKTLSKNVKIEEYKLPKIIFNFLDSFTPVNHRKTLVLFHELIELEPVEFVFTLLSKHMRDLYWVLNDPLSIPYPLWRINKLKFQAKKFSVIKIKQIINELAEIDIKAKTSEVNLVDSLDQLIITKLE